MTFVGKGVGTRKSPVDDFSRLWQMGVSVPIVDVVIMKVELLESAFRLFIAEVILSLIEAC